MKKKKDIAIGIVGVGRLGSVIAQKLSSNFEVLVADKAKFRAVALSKVTAVRVATLSGIFGKSDVLLLVVPPEQMVTLVKKYHKYLKAGAVVVNLATGVPTVVLRKVIGRKKMVDVVGMKMIGQAHALALGFEVCFVFAAEDEKLFTKLKKIFAVLGRVVRGDEKFVAKINAQATKYGLSLAMRLVKLSKDYALLKKPIDNAVKTVALGTVLDYPPAKDNKYIKQMLKAMKGDDYLL